MKASKLVLGTLVLAAATLPAHAQKLVGAGTGYQASGSQVNTMAMAAPNAQPMAAIFAPRTAVTLPMVRNSSPALLGIRRAPKFQTLTVYKFPAHAIKPVRTNVFPAANYVAPTVRFHVASAQFPVPSFVAPSVKFHVAPAGFTEPNYIAPSVKYQASPAGFAAPNYLSPSMAQQLEAAEFPVPVLGDGSIQEIK